MRPAAIAARAAAGVLVAAFAAATLVPAAPDGVAGAGPGDRPAARVPDVTAGAVARAAGAGLVAGPDGVLRPSADVGGRDNGRPPAADTAQRRSLADAPRELLAYAVSCGDLRAVEPREGGRIYRLDGIANACAPGWAPDGRIVVVGPLGRPPGSVSALRLLGRDGVAEIVEVPERSVTGRPAIWSDGTIEVCAVSRRSPYRLGLYRRQPGAREARFRVDGCFPSVSRLGWLAYVTGTRRESPAPGTMRELRIEERDGRVLLRRRLAAAVIDLRWTGDGSHLVAVTSEDGRGSVEVVDLDGDVRTLALAPQGALSIYPAPSGTAVAIVRTRSDATARVDVVDVRSGVRRWTLTAVGVTRVAWRPTGQVALVADGERWRLVDGTSGEPRADVPRLGGEPAWCCPRAVPAIQPG